MGKHIKIRNWRTLKIGICTNTVSPIIRSLSKNQLGWKIERSVLFIEISQIQSKQIIIEFCRGDH